MVGDTVGGEVGRDVGLGFFVGGPRGLVGDGFVGDGMGFDGVGGLLQLDGGFAAKEQI